MSTIKVWSLDNCLSTQGNLSDEEAEKQLVDKLRSILEHEADELVWVVINEYEEEK